MIFFGVVPEWERHALFFLGKFSRMVPPGLYFYIPFLHRIFFHIDMQIITYTVPLQQGLTKDNIPVKVDAIVFYQVKDPKIAILNVDDYHKATQLSARTAIRDMVGKSQLDELLSERKTISKYLQVALDGAVSRMMIGQELEHGQCVFALPQPLQARAQPSSDRSGGDAQLAPQLGLRQAQDQERFEDLGIRVVSERRRPQHVDELLKTPGLEGRCLEDALAHVLTRHTP